MQPFAYRGFLPTQTQNMKYMKNISNSKWRMPPLDLHCRVACRCSPNSAGPSWLPSDTADIHKNRLSKRRGGGSDDGERERERETAMCRGRRRTNNDLQKPHDITDTKTNSSVSVWDIASAARVSTRLQCSAIQWAEPLHSSQRNGTPPLRPYLPLETPSKASFLPQQWDLHISTPLNLSLLILVYTRYSCND